MRDLEKIISAEILISSATISECPWYEKNLYADYVAQTFYYVKHSTRLLALSASRLSYEQQSIHMRFIKHLGEESNHERLALSDLKNLGFDINDFPELISTKLFYEPQYYKVEHENPLALMGYIIYLEAMAQKICPPLTKKLSQLHGVKTVSFLKVHGEEDPEHVEQAYKLLNSLDPKSLEIIINNISQSSFAYNQMLRELKMKWANLEMSKAA